MLSNNQLRDNLAGKSTKEQWKFYFKQVVEVYEKANPHEEFTKEKIFEILDAHMQKLHKGGIIQKDSEGRFILPKIDICND